MEIKRNYIGERAGKLVVVGCEGKAADGHQLLRCVCDCGNIVMRKSNSIVYGQRTGTISHCGCSAPRPNLIHGGRCKPEYRHWQAIKRRCTDKRDKDFPRYGGAGIRMAECFLSDFAAFLAEVGPRPSPSHQVDRIDTRLGYVPGNIRWATITENARNRRTSYLWWIKGEHFDSSTDAARRFGVTVQTIIRWTDGSHDKRRGSFSPARPDCRRELRYGN